MIGKVLKPVLFVVFFNVVAIGVLLVLPPAIGLSWVLLLGCAYLWSQLRKSKGWRRRRVRTRLRAPNAPARWIALTCVSTLLLLFGIGGVIQALGTPLDPQELRGWDQLRSYQATTMGWIAFSVLIALVIPIVEEINFRGRVQRALERKYGLGIALAVASLLFMISHLGVPRSAILLIPLTLGIANGLAAVSFNSIWVGVVTHMLWNGSMAVLGRITGNEGGAAVASHTSPIAARSAVLIVIGVAGWWLVLRRRSPRPVAELQ